MGAFQMEWKALKFCYFSEWCQRRLSGVFNLNFEQFSHMSGVLQYRLGNVNTGCIHFKRGNLAILNSCQFFIAVILAEE